MEGMDSPSNDLAPRASGAIQSAPGGRPIPGPAEMIALDAAVDPLAFLGGLLKTYGDVVRFVSRYGPSFVFAHPVHVKAVMQSENFRRASLVKIVLGEGLLASDGPHWKSQRKLMQKDFQPAQVANFAGLITREIHRTEKEWRDAFAAGRDVDVMSAMTRLTLRIIVAALFSHDLSDEHAARLCESVTHTITELGKISWTIFGAPFHFSPERNAQFDAAQKVMDDTCYEMIARRRLQPAEQQPADLLTLLLATADGETPLTEKQIRDELVTMLVGGHETTALALSWAWKAFAENPDIEAKLHREVDQLIPDRPPQIADLPRLEWTRAVFQEALRLFPPVWYMGRVAIEEDTIDGYVIPRGACVMISPWFTHRHKDFWQSPDAFDPARFLDDAAIALHKTAYFPFAGGRHQCLGIHLAMMEGTFILAQLSQRFKVQPIAGQNVRPLPGITLRQSPPLRAMIEPRTASHLVRPFKPEAA
jgi:cytochrome P450